MISFKRGTLIVTAAVLFSVGSSASAYWMSSDGGMSLSIGAGNYLLSQQVLSDAVKAGTSGKSDAQQNKTNAVSTVIPKPTGAEGIEVLVSGYSDTQKPEARKLFQQMVEMFEPVAAQMKVPAYDMGSAAAALISGSYAAYHNETLTEEHFKPLAEQMQAALAQDEDFQKMSAPEKERMYQVLVGTGMFLTLAQLENAKNPDPQVTAQLQAGGKDFLEKFTRLQPQKLKLDGQGLSLRD